MENPFQYADDFGPEKIIHVYEPKIGLKGILVVDNVSAGPSIGGTRMVPDISVKECFRLARAMTFKNAMAGLSHGGGKSMIMGDPEMPVKEKERLIRAFAQTIRDVKDYVPGPDMGTNEACMAWVYDETGRVIGLPKELGGIPLDELGVTAYGLTVAIDVAKDFCDLSLKGSRVVIQGFGSVGKHAARFLSKKGAHVIAVSDLSGALQNPDGIDIDGLIKFKEEGRKIGDFPGGHRLERDDIIDIDCDIWIPAARPDIINTSNVNRLKTRILAQGANIPATDEAEEILYRKGILVLPDFIANAGGVICGAIELAGGSEASVFPTIKERISKNMKDILGESQSKGLRPREIAMNLARQRVRQAMTYRRSF